MASYIWNKEIYTSIDADGENGILLDTELGEYFKVHGLYAEIVRLCQKKTSLIEIENELKKNFEIVNKNEVVEVLEDYQNRGWILNE